MRARPSNGRRGRSALAIAALVVAVSLPAEAGAQLSVTTTAAPTFAVTLTGTDQTATYSFPMTVTDATGSGSGWHLTLTSTQFTTGGATPRTLPASASRVTTATAACAAGTCTDPVNDVALPVTIPAAPTAPAAATFFNAQPGTGLGEFTVTAGVAVAVPANAYAGTYSSTLTVAVVSGP